MKPVLAITVGDFNGIGPEIALKAIASAVARRACTPVLVGPIDVFKWYRRKLRLELKFQSPAKDARKLPSDGRKQSVRLVETSEVTGIHPGLIAEEAGRAAGEAIASATQMAMEGDADAIVTAPISKRALHLAGLDYPGHTEYIQHLTGAAGVAMMLVTRDLRIGLVTIHIPLSEVASVVTSELIIAKTLLVHHALRRDWQIRKPRIALLGLNPHAGEDGDIGTEEATAIAPALRILKNQSVSVEGPFPADAFFARYRPGEWDAVLAMYHDQGLIPLKMAGKGKAVNVTIGLPIVRTSPDHGTAFDIAGKGAADPSSMIEAIKLAAMVARNRRKGARRTKQ
jgi:4-hydroxythreonine-4-phosphate dehydrogenase